MKTGTLSRRKFLASGLASGSLVLGRRAAVAEQVCVLTAEQEVGPFYVDGMMLRVNIAEDRAGIPLKLRIVITDSGTCKPIPDAAIDLWHCDAMGLYSGFTKTSLGGPGGFGPGGDRPDGPPAGPPPDGMAVGPGGPPPTMKPSDKLTFLRGIQMTDRDGAVTFQTIFPGFYNGRTNHVHFKVRLAGHREGDLYAAGHTSHVGQVFFPEDWNVKLMASGPYAEHKIHRTTEAEDMVYQGQHGPTTVATLIRANAARPEAGLVAELHVAVDPAATPKAIGGGPGFGGPPPKD